MASITGHCPVCREIFNPENRRPHCIPCGHLFCLDCLTRMCGHTFGSCPFCRTTFYPEDIRWLFFSYELDSSTDGLRYPSSDSIHCPTVLGWLCDARDGLEAKLLQVVNDRDCPNEVLSELQGEINAWLSAYEATEISRVPENRALEIAAGTLAIASQRTEHMEKLQAQMKVMRRDVRMLQKETAEIAKAREDAELKIKEKDIEIRALRDLNRLYRHVSGIKGTGPPHLQTLPEVRRTKRTKISPRELEEFNPSKPGAVRHGKKLATLPGAADVASPDSGGRSEHRAEKSVTWFRTSLRRTAAIAEVN